MTDKQWTEIEAGGKLFSRKEKWGDPYAMDFEFLRCLKAFRKMVGRSIFIHCAYETSGHSPKSLHGMNPCVAADLHIKGKSLIQEVELALNFSDIHGGFHGVGIYPHSWYSAGLHLDMRGWKEKRHPIYWIEDDKKAGNYIYFTDADKFYDAMIKIPRCLERI